MMKATGIVRRIDDLGRVVIPKEIRRNLHIREGEPLEIFVDKEGEIILKKYSPIGELASFANECCDVLYDVLQTSILITDRDSIIAVAGINKKELVGKEVGESIEQAMVDRRIISQNADAKKNLQGILQEELIEQEEYFNSGLIIPIIAQGDPIGAVVIGSKANLGETESKVAQSMAGVLAKQMEF